MNKLILGIILTLVPFIELRGGLPLVILHAKAQALPIWPFFILILILNTLIILFAFYFLDFLHIRLMKNKTYKRFFESYLERSQKKIKRFQDRHKKIGFLGLYLFTAIPLPITGAYSATLLCWLTGLNRIKSTIAIFFGLLTAEIIILLITLGLI